MTEASRPSAGRIRGKSASRGVAHGELYFLDEGVDTTKQMPRTENGSEREHFDQAIKLSVLDLTGILEHLDDEQASAMLEFQLAMIEDEAVQDPVLRKIGSGVRALDAWLSVLNDEITDYESSEDDYFRGRAVDIKDIRDRVARHLIGAADFEIPRGSIVVAADITPSRFLGTDWGEGGVALTQGSRSGHVAMLARAQSVPMVVGLESLPGTVEGEVFLDADAGELVVAADHSERRSLLDRMAGDRLQRQRESDYLRGPAVTPWGEPIRVLINLADPDELEAIDPDVCDGVGLVRTEFLFHGGESLPSEDEQYDVYRRIVEWAGGKAVTIRTLDAGGDKPVAGLTEPDEANPFLGVRGIRLSLANVDVFRVQIRALLRAAAIGPLKIMVPMVTVPDEMEAVRRICEEEKQRLDRSGQRRGEPLLGMMVEVPATAITIEDFDADFYSVGSNDLIQYVTACSRDANHLDHLYRGDNPAVLKLIENVVAHAARTRREVSVCGEMAGDESHIGGLIDIGVRTLSVSPGVLAKTKFVLAHLGDAKGG